MPKVSPLQNDFSVGEISPRILGRVDEDSYKRALEVCKNYVPYTQGPLTRRPGSIHAAEVKTSSGITKLIPFVFSAQQAYVLELGDVYMRFYTNNAPVLDGGSPYEIVTPWTAAQAPDVTYAQTGDVMYMAHPNHYLRKLTRLGDTNWTLEVVTFDEPAYYEANRLPAATPTKAVRTSTLTPNGTTGLVDLVMGPNRTITSILDDGAGNTDLIIADHGFVNGDRIGVDGGNKILIDLMVTLDAATDDRVVDSNTIKIRPSFPGAGYDGTGYIYPDIYPGAGSYLRILQGSTWGWGEVTDRGIFVGHNPFTTVVVKSDFASTAASPIWRVNRIMTPSVVTFHQDRLALAGYSDEPQRVDMSETGSFEDFSPSQSTGSVVASNAISFTLLSNDVNSIKNMLSGPKGLFIGTLGGEWIVRPSSAGEALTPANVNASRSTTFGCAADRAVQVGNAVVFIQKTGKKIRDSIYSFQLDGFRSNDLTMLSESLTRKGVTNLTFQKDPIPIVWSVREDGTLLGLSYERLDDQAVRFGMHRHEFGGSATEAGAFAKVESLAVIPSSDGSRDELWLVVKRYINGATVRYVEYLSKFYEDTDDAQDVICVDSAVTSTNASPVSSVSGLAHLEGETVAVWADGAVQPEKVVASGSITLTTAASVIQVGLPYNSDAKLLPMEAGSANGTALGKTRRTHRVGLLFHKTLGVKTGPSFDNLTEIIFRSASDLMGVAVPLFSGIKSLTFDADYNFENNVCIRQSDPAPGTILAITPQMVTNDR